MELRRSFGSGSRGAALLALVVAALAAQPFAAAADSGAAAAIVLTESACFDRAQLGAEVDRYLDHPLDPAAAVTVRDGIDRLVIESASGAVDKDVSGWSCQQRLEFAAVSVSIILGGDYTPRAALASVPDAGPPDSAAPTAAVPVAPPPPAASAAPLLLAPTRPTVEIAAEGGALFGLLPGPAAGLQLSADRTLIGPLDLHASLLLTSSVAAPFRSAYAEASLLAGLIEGCLARGDALRLRLCAGLAAGRLGVSWAGLSPVSTPSAWSAAAGRVDLHFNVSRQVSFAAGVDIFFPFGQQRIDVVEPSACPDGVPSAVVPLCNAVTPYSAGRVVESHSLSGPGLMLSVGPVLRFW
jgi:hypothetical protein